MARPERHDVDYFPFYVKEGKTLFILESKYGLQGIGFFTNLMRFLYKQPDHYICIKEESDRLYFFAQIHCQEDIGLDMINLMAKTGKIDLDLWEKNKVIASEDLLNSLLDAYKNRKNEIIKIDEIRVSYPDNPVSYPDNPITYPDNTQTKLKKTKLKETKQSAFDISTLPFFISKETWEEFCAMRIEKKEPINALSGKRIIAKLTKMQEQTGQDPNEILSESIMNGWKGVFPLKQDTGGKNGRYGNSTGRPGVQIKVYDPPPRQEISDEERRRAIERIRKFTGDIG
jgi:hypothetical protein